MPLHVSSTMCSSSGGQNLYYTASGIITTVGGRSVHRLREDSLCASTCFEHYVLIIRLSKLYYTASGIITLIGGRPVHRLREDSLCASTCFEHYVLIVRRSKVYHITSGIITRVGGCPVHSILSTCAPDDQLQTDETRCCKIKFLPPDDEHNSARNM